MYCAFAAFIFGCVLTFAFAPFDLFFCVPIALSGLLFVLGKAPYKVIFIRGFCFGIGHFTSSLYWISYALSFELEKFAWLIPFAFFGIPAALSLLISLLIMSWRPFLILAMHNANSLIVSTLSAIYFASSWCIFELLRTYFLHFPWNLLGYASNASIEFMQFGSIVGVYGLSFIIALFSFIFYTRNILLLASAAMCIALIMYWGGIRLQGRDALHSNAEKIEVRLVQPNIREIYNGDKKLIIESLKNLVDLSVKPSDSVIKLIIWPEAALYTGFNLENDDELRFLSQIIPDGGFLITGVDRFSKEVDGNLKVFNSMVVINQFGYIVDFYDKRILVPFGEYVPFNDVLWFINKITHGVVSFSNGGIQKIFNLPNIGSILPMICYEGIFDSLFFHVENKDLTLLLNITNDLWFRDSIGPIQHFVMAKMRAIEQGATLLRVGNTGISGVVDLYGIVIAVSKLNTRCVVDVSVPLIVQKNLYKKFYIFMPCIIIFLYCMCLVFLFMNKERFGNK